MSAVAVEVASADSLSATTTFIRFGGYVFSAIELVQYHQFPGLVEQRAGKRPELWIRLTRTGLYGG